MKQESREHHEASQCEHFSSIAVSLYSDGLDGRGSIPSSVKCLSLLHSVQIGSEAHPASIQSVPGEISPGIKRPGLDADHSTPSNTEVKNGEAIRSLPPYVFMG
jgi:hypothetical protein